MIRSVLPELSHIEPFQNATLGNGAAYVTVEQRVGVAFRLNPIDAEGPSAGELFTEMGRIVAKLKPGALLKILACAETTAEYPWKTSRMEAMPRLGWVRHGLTLLLETAPRVGFLRRLAGAGRGRGSFGPELDFLAQAIEGTSLRALGATSLDEAGTRALFAPPPSEMVLSPMGLASGTHHTAVIRLWRQGTADVGVETLAMLREELPAPYEIVVNVRKLHDVRSQYLLRRLRAQKAVSTDSTAVRTLETAEEALDQTTLAGRGLVELEWLLILARTSESAVKEDVAECARALSRLGDVAHEVYGALPSWLASRAGVEPHHAFLELDSLAPLYIPALIRGEAPPDHPPPRRGLPLHRRDGSLYHFDLFREGYDGANCIINGRRGKGKSVLANLISSSLLADPEVHLIKVDVGGSYIKECELSQGAHVQFNLSEPSGLNPFRLLRETVDKEDAAVIVATFLATLVQESKETVISKELQGVLESTVLAYAHAGRERPSLADFLEHSGEIPRRTLLERFSGGGVFANVLRERENAPDLTSNRYVYFNFERLQNAANEDFAQAVMAAVIATVNLEVLRAGDARRGAKNRVVFFADETPFFIQRNGRFFKLTTANFRKFGHGTVLIAQTTQDFVLAKEGGGYDTGILTNSPIRFFYQVDDAPEVFAERFSLTARQMADIQGLGREDAFREVFLQDELGARVLRVAVTPEEYWRVTSSRADNEKLYGLMKAVPGLRLEEAIRCLST